MKDSHRYLRLPYRKDEQGRSLCRMCGKLPPPGRRTWCSQACVDEYLARSSSAGLRRLAFARDHGICAICGRDTDQLNSRFLRARDRAHKLVRRFHRMGVASWDHPILRRLSRWRIAGGWPSDACRDWWDADHIVPVVRGGGQCGLENIRTLCVPCHKRETARLAAERAAERRS